VPHERQTRIATGVPHSGQNLALTETAAAHAEHSPFIGRLF
jgi:hypothetical protein